MKITCSKCGVAKSVRPEIFEKRVQKAGSKEALLASYLCRDCRPKAEKPVKTVQARHAAPKAKKLSKTALKAKNDARNARRRELYAQKKLNTVNG